MIVQVDKHKCTSCGLCWHEYPSFFSHDNNMLVESLAQYIPDCFYDTIQNIAAICSGEAIQVNRQEK